MEDLVARSLSVGGWRLDLLIPADSEALLSEEAFAVDEFMPYWAELWPSGMALAAAAEGIEGKVLEVGCGLGLPSLVAALGGASVVAVDWADDAVALLSSNASRVGARLRAQRWDWRDDPAALGGPFDVVLAADVLYEERNVPQLLAALPALVAPGGEAWIADPGRPTAPAFLAAAAEDWSITSDALTERITRYRLRQQAHFRAPSHPKVL